MSFVHLSAARAHHDHALVKRIVVQLFFKHRDPLPLRDDQFGQEADQEQQHADDRQHAGSDEDGTLLGLRKEL